MIDTIEKIFKSVVFFGALLYFVRGFVDMACFLMLALIYQAVKP